MPNALFTRAAAAAGVKVEALGHKPIILKSGKDTGNAVQMRKRRN